ncbi:hypothetical protein OJ997_31925 [Solirubrobacter phytolaccae]|uniref:DUF4352 domain-containing protein n=1 Tax=Solirubrobacter phytolaccae TaxID=1404360 RepID=A0A9X3SCP3_9ACTN|nr:hypothetical protein [Solirubrobacter phytolaccae]MDA0184956.1 hypothetical protein [Solirubrobacter phytolaccae]
MRRFLALAAVVALGLSGCGDKHAFNHEAETEGEYVDVGNLVYQVQMSRFLNPSDREDREYLTGLPAGVSPTLPGDETWFGVWMRVKNYTNETIQPAEDISVLDTEENRYEPVPLAESNPFAYNPRPLGADQVLPLPDTAAASGPIQGSLILYRLKTDSLQNRPLKLEIEKPGSETAEIDLDL